MAKVEILKRLRDVISHLPKLKAEIVSLLSI